jgi:hypothetical protein
MNIIEIAQAGIISDAPSLSKVGNNVLFFLLSVFCVIGIIMSVVYGLMYLTSYGDEHQIKKAKKGMTFAAVGVVLAFAAMVFIRLIGNLLN